MAYEPIDFSQYDKNLQSEACDDHLSVCRRSPVMMGFRHALVAQSQELYDANTNALLSRTINDAVDYQLDVIGQIVGQERIPFGAAGKWLTPDDAETLVDVSPVWLAGEPGGDPLADNDQYRILIKAKIFKNHVKYGSIPEIIEFSRLVFDGDISIKKLGLDDINLVVSSNFPPDLLPILISFIDDENADKQYFLPLPTGVRIVGVEYIPVPAFKPDSDTAGPDLGLLAVASGGLT